MSHLMHVVNKRLVRLLLAGGLLTGAVGAPAMLTAGSAEAAACGSATLAGVSCTLTGTLNLLPGTLTLTSPTALAWSGTVTGLDQSLVDATSAHQSYAVDDATGSGLGWHVTASATTFTTGTVQLPDTGTFLTTGSITSVAGTTAPTAACSSGATCTLPTDTTS